MSINKLYIFYHAYKRQGLSWYWTALSRFFFSPHEAGLAWKVHESVSGVTMKRPKQKMNSPIVNCVLLPYKNAIIVPCQKSSFWNGSIWSDLSFMTSKVHSCQLGYVLLWLICSSWCDFLTCACTDLAYFWRSYHSLGRRIPLDFLWADSNCSRFLCDSLICACTDLAYF